jgi:hypothetical protein
MADANVFVRYLADASKLVGESKRATRATKGVGSASKKTEGQFNSMAGGMVRFFAGTAVAAGMASWIKGGIEMADTADLIRKSWDKTFTTSGDTLVANLTETRKALGLGEFEMQKLLVTTGQLAQQQGMTKEASAAFAEQLFVMAGDVAAFTGELDNAPAVLGAFQAAIRGEFDPLEQFGIKLSQAAINNRALADSGKESVAELTDQEKQTALLSLITEALADETGALAEAIEDGATVTNEMSAEMKDAQESIGQAAQEIKFGMSKAVLGLIDGLRSLGRWIGRTLSTLTNFSKTATGLLGAVTRFLSDLLNMIFGVGRGASNMAARFRGAMNSVLGPIRGVRNAIAGLSSRVSGVLSRIRSISFLGFAQGGMVPGAPGQAQLAVVHGGERVQTPQQQRMGGGGSGGAGTVINVTVNAGLANPNETATAVVDLLRLYQRTQGAVPAGNDPG